MKTLTLAITFLASVPLYAQTGIKEELYGFRLGQYREVTINEFGEPASTVFLEDSLKVEFFYLNPDSTTHIGFIYLYQSDEIYSIQLTGEPVTKTFQGVNLGSKPNNVTASFGKPDRIDKQEFDGDSVNTFFYDNKNYSFVFQKDKLNSIKIWDPLTEPDYESGDFQLPTLESIVNSLKTNDRSAITGFLSSGLEIFYCDDIIAWEKSIGTEIENTDHSLFEFIFNEQYGLATLSQYDSIPAKMNLRLIEGVGSLPVYKFQSESLFEEIAFMFQQGRYKIWEIKYKCDN